MEWQQSCSFSLSMPPSSAEGSFLIIIYSMFVQNRPNLKSKNAGDHNEAIQHPLKKESLWHHHLKVFAKSKSQK